MDYKTREYKVTNVQPTLGIFVLAEEMNKIDKIKEDAKFMCQDFFERFLPEYRQ